MYTFGDFNMSESNKIVSTLTGGPVKLVLQINKEEIRNRYKQEFDIDISSIIDSCDSESIELYECMQSGFRFFYPLNVSGDGLFYEQLEKISWYYADWKWEYNSAKKYFQKNDTVLDIGCGEAKYLQYLKNTLNCNTYGLELNVKAKQIAELNGLSVYNESIEKHAVENDEKYDVVCFFQVLEHIKNPNSFIESAIKTIKKGGKMIIAVPNNNPFFLTYDKYQLLNLPPHHMGWWNEKSLNFIAQNFDVQLNAIELQPLQHFKSYTKSFLSSKFPDNQLLRNALYPILKALFYFKRKKINGATIMAVYTKT
jgi:2-polyprenyl-3-methyl-5-hydroxy-6-metoxy-1,4-benzoquinol methylase